MTRVINAIYEDGVFKPLQDVEVKEHEQVEIKILFRDEWESRFDRVLKKVHEKAAAYSPEEIEADIAAAVKEVRESRRAR